MYKILYLPEACFIVDGDTPISNLKQKTFSSLEEAETLIKEGKIGKVSSVVSIKYDGPNENIYYTSSISKETFINKEHLFEIIEFTDEI